MLAADRALRLYKYQETFSRNKYFLFPTDFVLIPLGECNPRWLVAGLSCGGERERERERERESYAIYNVPAASTLTLLSPGTITAPALPARETSDN